MTSAKKNENCLFYACIDNSLGYIIFSKGNVLVKVKVDDWKSL